MNLPGRAVHAYRAADLLSWLPVDSCAALPTTDPQRQGNKASARVPTFQAGRTGRNLWRTRVRRAANAELEAVRDLPRRSANRYSWVQIPPSPSRDRAIFRLLGRDRPLEPAARLNRSARAVDTMSKTYGACHDAL